MESRSRAALLTQGLKECPILAWVAHVNGRSRTSRLPSVGLCPTRTQVGDIAAHAHIATVACVFAIRYAPWTFSSAGIYYLLFRANTIFETGFSESIANSSSCVVSFLQRIIAFPNTAFIFIATQSGSPTQLCAAFY